MKKMCYKPLSGIHMKGNTLVMLPQQLCPSYHIQVYEIHRKPNGEKPMLCSDRRHKPSDVRESHLQWWAQGLKLEGEEKSVPVWPGQGLFRTGSPWSIHWFWSIWQGCLATWSAPGNCSASPLQDELPAASVFIPVLSSALGWKMFLHVLSLNPSVTTCPPHAGVSHAEHPFLWTRFLFRKKCQESSSLRQMTHCLQMDRVYALKPIARPTLVDERTQGIQEIFWLFASWAGSKLCFQSYLPEFHYHHKLGELCCSVAFGTSLSPHRGCLSSCTCLLRARRSTALYSPSSGTCRPHQLAVAVLDSQLRVSFALALANSRSWLLGFQIWL